MNEIISRLTWVEYLAAAAVLRGFYVGYRGGLFPEVLRIAVYLATVIVALQFRDNLAQLITLNSFLNAESAEILATVGLGIAVFLILKFATIVLLKILKIGEGGFAYRILGMVLGGARWVILLSLAFMAVGHSPPLANLKNDIEKRSIAGPQIVRVAPTIFDFLSTLSPQLTVPKNPPVKLP